jgi:hypothetical protein
MTVRRRLARLAAVVLVGCAAVLFTGCVYLRLLELKHQIAAFDRNFAVQTDDGVRIVCRNPVLLSGDVRWIGLTPERTRRVGSAEEWHVRWVKELPPTVHESGAFDITVELLFSQDKLTRVAIPERYFALMPKSLLLDLLRSLGGAKVDKGSRSVEAQLASSRPNLAAIEKLLGQPTERQTAAGSTLLRYRYVPVGAAGAARRAVFDMALYFQPDSGQLLRWQARTPVGNLGFNFQQQTSPATPSAPPAP